MEETKAELPRCKICGATIPEGKTLCWCCEHGPKLHDPFALRPIDEVEKSEKK